jgi:hypothetical protein
MGALCQAVDKGTKIIDEDGLLSLIRAAPDPSAGAGEAAAEDSGDDVAFVSAAPPPAGRSSKAELNKMPGSSKAAG